MTKLDPTGLASAMRQYCIQVLHRDNLHELPPDVYSDVKRTCTAILMMYLDAAPERITIGRFILEKLPEEPGRIFIHHNRQSVSSGEGGSFPQEAVERLIDGYYQEDF